jgi:hypothetical protein
MTTTAGHRFDIGPIGSFYNQVNDTGSWERLVIVFFNSNFILIFLKKNYWWRVGDCLFDIYHISVLFIISHWLEI